MKFYYNGKTYHISFGNKKLKGNSETTFFIWNLPAIITCPFRTPLCTDNCYAVKAERQYKKTCLPARRENLENSKSETFVQDIISIIEYKLKYLRKSKKHFVVRIHESGDFYCKKYAMAWLEIARHFINDSRVEFIAYTKSFIYFDGVKLPSNFKLRASIWADTTPEQLAIVIRNGWPIYTAVQKFTPNDTFTQCRCSDCATCARCWNNSIKDIRCEIH